MLLPIFLNSGSLPTVAFILNFQSWVQMHRSSVNIRYTYNYHRYVNKIIFNNILFYKIVLIYSEYNPNENPPLGYAPGTCNILYII